VGGRGQERLLCARVIVAGCGPAAEHAALLLERAGVGHVDRTGAPNADADAIVDLGDQAAGLAERALEGGVPLVAGRLAGDSVLVATLVGRPCGACASLGDHEPDATHLGTTGALVLGALAASEVLRALWFAPPAARVHTLDLERGCFRVTAPPATAGCAVCRSGA
jgi:hypothetical protein